ncbi:MAG: hypothetical protein [Arizlama microvirus]|nr:MAG: hypothetical protein [Arizlama microvirus]
MRRSKIYNKGKDRRQFSRTASMVHKKNMQSGVMRGGYRL